MLLSRRLGAKSGFINTSFPSQIRGIRLRPTFERIIKKEDATNVKKESSKPKQTSLPFQNKRIQLVSRFNSPTPKSTGEKKPRKDRLQHHSKPNKEDDKKTFSGLGLGDEEGLLDQYEDSKTRNVALIKALMRAARREQLSEQKMFEEMSPEDRPTEPEGQEPPRQIITFTEVKRNPDSSSWPINRTKTTTLFLVLEAIFRSPDGTEAFNQQLMLQLIGMARSLPNNLDQALATTLTCDILYSSKEGRLDIINEWMYIEALILCGKYDKAIQLWTTRKPSIEEGGRWWSEHGIVLYAACKEFPTMEMLATKALEVYGFLNPRIVSIIVEKYCALEDFERAGKWLKYFMIMVEKGGMVRAPKQAPNFHEGDEQKILDYWNKKEKPTDLDVLRIFDAYANAGNLEVVSSLLKLLNANEDIYDRAKVLIRKLDFFVKINILPKVLEMESTEEARELFKELINEFSTRNPEYLEDAQFYQLVIRHISILGDYDEVVRNLEEMAQRKIQPNPKDFQRVLRALIKSRKLDVATELLQKMETSRRLYLQGRSYGIIPPVNANHYALFVLAYSRNGEYQKIQNILEKVMELKLEFTAAFFDAFLNHCYRTGKISKAFNFLRKNWDNDFEKSARLYDTVFRIHRGAYEQPKKVKRNTTLGLNLRDLYVQMTLDRSVLPSVVACQRAAEALCYGGDFAGAVAVLQHMGMKLGFRPTADFVARIDKISVGIIKNKIGSMKMKQKDIPIQTEFLEQRHRELLQLAKAKSISEESVPPWKRSLQALMNPRTARFGDWKIPASQLICTLSSIENLGEFERELEGAQEYFMVPKLESSFIVETNEFVKMINK